MKILSYFYAFSSEKAWVLAREGVKKHKNNHQKRRYYAEKPKIIAILDQKHMYFYVFSNEKVYFSSRGGVKKPQKHQQESKI